MNQDLIVFIIVLLTVSYTIYHVVKTAKVKKGKSVCGGCSGCDLTKREKDYSTFCNNQQITKSEFVETIKIKNESTTSYSS